MVRTKSTKGILKERKRQEKASKQHRASVRHSGDSSALRKRWMGWREHEAPSKVVTYNLVDLEKEKEEKK